MASGYAIGGAGGAVVEATDGEQPLTSSLGQLDLNDIDMGAGEFSCEWCFVFAVDGDRDERKKIVKTLKAAGLETRLSLSRDEDEIFCKVSASEERFEDEAERIEYEKELKDERRGWGKFRVDIKEEFKWKSKTSFFSSGERVYLMENILRSPNTDGGCGFDLDRLSKEKKCVMNFAVTHKEELEWLAKHWVSVWTDDQPLNEIRDYFGEKIAMYFAWLGFYTSLLWVPGILGFILFLMQTFAKSSDSVMVPYYCVFLAFWATGFLEFWKRKQVSLAYDWNVMDFEEEEKPRPEFNGVMRENPLIPGKWELYYEPWRRYLKYSMSIPLSFMIIMSVIVGTLGIMALRYFMLVTKEMSQGAGGTIAGILNGIFMVVMNNLYQGVAEKLNDWENHRTDTDYENNLTMKVFLFQFINSFTSLFYIGFIKGNVGVFGIDASKDQCKNNDCIGELRFQLGGLFVFKTVLGQILEIGVPFLKQKIKVWKEGRALDKAERMGSEVEAAPRGAGRDDVDPEAGRDRARSLAHYAKESEGKQMSFIEFESKKEVFKGTFDEYNEMIIQFGFVTLFAAAFPLTPFIALLNNITEIRGDALKVCRAVQRPPFKRAENIGTWYGILEIMAVLAVIVNCFMIAFVTDAFDDKSTATRLWIAVILEHMILIIKFFVQWAIPDVPEDVEAGYEIRKYYEALHDAEIKKDELAEKQALFDEKMAQIRDDDL